MWKRKKLIQVYVFIFIISISIFSVKALDTEDTCVYFDDNQLEQTWVYGNNSGSEDITSGSPNNVCVYNGDALNGFPNYRCYTKLNLSPITRVGTTVRNAYVNVRYSTVQSAFNAAVFHVKVGYNMTNITGRMQPCGNVMQANNQVCNGTPMQNKSISTTGNQTWNITTAVQEQLNLGYKNVSFLLKRADGGTTNSYHETDSVRDETGNRPYGVVCYDYNIELTNCSLGNPVINFTFLDEVTNLKVLGTATVNFNYGSSLSVLGNTYTNTYTNYYNYSVCMTPSFANVSTDYQIEYSVSGYQGRSLTVSGVVLSNSTQTKNIYLLSTSDGIYGTFKIVDAFSNALSQVLIEMRDTSGSLLQAELTDDAGVASFWVNPDTTYSFTFTKTGYAIKTSSLNIVSSDLITVILEQQNNEQTTSYFSGISYVFNPKNTLLQNQMAYTFNFSLSSTFWNMTNCELYIRNASTVFNQTSCFYNSTQLNASIRLNTQNYTKLILEAVYQINNSYNFTVNSEYKVQYQYQGRGSLKNFLDDITNFTDGGFDAFGRFLIGIIATVLVLGWMVKEGSLLREDEILIPTVIILTWLFSYLGWYYIPFEMPQIRFLAANWLNQWIVSVLVTIAGVSYLVRDNL